MPMHPYTEADKIDTLLNKTLKKFPMDEDNIREWGTYLRTVRSFLTIINAHHKNKLRTHFERKHGKPKKNGKGT